MLKFADVTVPEPKGENEFILDNGMLSHYLNHFKGSFMPSLLGYLDIKKKLKVVSDIKGIENKVLIRISRQEILSFCNFTEEEAQALVIRKGDDIDTFTDWIYEIPAYSKNVYEASAIAEMLLFLKNEGEYTYLVAEVDDSPILLEIIRIIKAHDFLLQQGDNAALCFFYLLLKQENNVFEYEEEPALYHNSWYHRFDTLFDATQRSYSFGSNTQPKELTRIILSLYEGGFVYNPFAGFGSYHSEMSRGAKRDAGRILCSFENGDELFTPNNSLEEHYYADEIDEVVWAAGRLRLLAYNMDSPNYILGDSVKGFNADVEWVVSTPPFGLQLINELGKKEYADHMTVRRGLDLFTEEGMFVCVVPMSFFTREDTRDVRYKLVEEKLLTQVVFLPDNIFSNTKISAAIIIAQKGHYQDKIKFVDATRMTIGSKVRTNVLDVAAISNLIKHDTYPGEFKFTFGKKGECERLSPSVFNECIRFTKYEDVAAIDYDLEPASYFTSYIEVPDGFRLEKLENLTGNAIRGTMNPNKALGLNLDILHASNGIPYINVGNILNSAIGSDMIAPNDILGKIISRRLTSKSLVISTIGGLRPAILTPSEGGSILLSPHAFAFSIDEEKVNPEYLVFELSQDYIKEQLRYKTIGGPVNLLKLKDLNALEILVPNGTDSLKLQESIVQERKNAYLEEIGIKLSDLKDKRHDEYVKSLRQRKHRIQQLMNEFVPAFSLLNSCRMDNNGILRDEDIVAPRTGETVAEYFQKLQTIVENVEDLITNLVDKEHWAKPSQIEIVQYVNNLPDNHISDKYDFQITDVRTLDIINEEEDVPNIVEINKTDLDTIFDNIIANAVKWGFNDPNRKDYSIHIEIGDTIIDNKQGIRIAVSNNGTPIHKSVDRKRFFDWGYGSGTGIGTWQLKDIIEHYGGSICLNEYPDDVDGFQTEYEINLPLKIMYEWKEK